MWLPCLSGLLHEMLKAPMIIRLSSLDIFSVSSSMMSSMNMLFVVLPFALAGG